MLATVPLFGTLIHLSAITNGSKSEAVHLFKERTMSAGKLEVIQVAWCGIRPVKVTLKVLY